MESIIKAWDAFVRMVRPDVDAIITTFLKAQRKLETLIEREIAALTKEAAAVEALIERRVVRNSIIDRAYRVVHNLDKLTA